MQQTVSVILIIFLNMLTLDVAQNKNYIIDITSDYISVRCPDDAITLYRR